MKINIKRKDSTPPQLGDLARGDVFFRDLTGNCYMVIGFGASYVAAINLNGGNQVELTRESTKWQRVLDAEITGTVE